MTSPESELAALLDNRAEAIRHKDLDLLMSFYSPDIVYFDVVPPLQYVGSAALRGRFTHWFDGLDSGIGQEVRDQTIAVNGNLAYTSMLIRSSGTLKNGPEVSRWVRATSCCQRIHDTWLVTHEHVSVPVDITTGATPTDLKP
jgi:ketosteroid isomerase-like protein